MSGREHKRKGEIESGLDRESQREREGELEREGREREGERAVKRGRAGETKSRIGQERERA